MSIRSVIIVVSLCVPLVLPGQQQVAIAWQRVLGGSNLDFAAMHLATADGGNVILGTTASVDGDLRGMPEASRRGHDWYGADLWLIKLNADHDIEWQRVYGGTARDSASYIATTSDGGYIISCRSESTDGDFATSPGTGPAVILKVTPTGAIEWSRRFEAYDIYSIQETDDGHFIFSASYIYSGFAVIGKLKHDGTLVWMTNYKSKNVQYYNTPNDLHLTTDNGYVLAGYTYGQMWAAKFLDTNNVSWERLIGKTGTTAGSFMEATADGGYMLMWSTYTDDNNTEVMLKKLDADGNTRSEWTYPDLNTSGSCVKQVGNNGYVFIAGSSENLVAYRIDVSGGVIWRQYLGGSGFEQTTRSITNEIPRQYTFSSTTYSNDGDFSGINHGSADIWMFSLKEAGSGVEQTDELQEMLTVTPNPSSDIIRLEATASFDNIAIVDIDGRQVRSYDGIRSPQFEINIADLANGTYFVVASSDGLVVAREKFVKY